MAKRSSSILVDDEYLKLCLRVSAAERFRRLEQLRDFFRRAMPLQTKKLWGKMAEQGW
jgi:hypothetical protein